MSDSAPNYIDNSAFIEGSKLMHAWDSVSIGEFKRCPRAYELGIVEGWAAKEMRVDLEFGILLHSVRERFYHAKAQGLDHDGALCESLAWLFEATFDKEASRPWQTENANKNRFTLIRTFVWYADTWKDDPLETVILASGKPAVELSFKLNTGLRINGQSVLLCGHMDRIAKMGDKTYVSDLKSTKNTLDKKYFRSFSPDSQLSLYALAAQNVYAIKSSGIIIDAAQIAVTFTRFQREAISRTQAQLDEWFEGFKEMLFRAQIYAERNFWPLNERACFNCQFRRICSLTPEARANWLSAEFVRRRWNPLENRGDI